MTPQRALPQTHGALQTLPQFHPRLERNIPKPSHPTSSLSDSCLTHVCLATVCEEKAQSCLSLNCSCLPAVSSSSPTTEKNRKVGSSGLQGPNLKQAHMGQLFPKHVIHGHLSGAACYTYCQVVMLSTDTYNMTVSIAGPCLFLHRRRKSLANTIPFLPTS